MKPEMPFPEEAGIKSVQNSFNKSSSARAFIYFMHLFLTFITPSPKETVALVVANHIC